MQIKVKHLVKWFLMLFPFILFFTLYLKMGDELFLVDDYIPTNYFIHFIFCICEEFSDLLNPISRVIFLFISPNLSNWFDLFRLFDSGCPQYMFLATIVFCLTWMIMMWILWSILDLLAHLWHKLTRTEEE